MHDQNIYGFINSSDDCFRKKPASPNPEQMFLHNLWLTFESIQDQITDHNSLESKFFEILEPIIFNLWVETGGVKIPNHSFKEYFFPMLTLNISSDSSDTFTANLFPTNFYFVPVKTINPLEDYRQKLTKTKKSQYSRLSGSKMDFASLKSFFDEDTRPNLQYLHEKYYFQDEDKLIFSEWRHA